MKGIKNRILVEIQNYQGILETNAESEQLAEALTQIFVREAKQYLYQFDLPTDIAVKIANDLNELKTDDPKFTFTHLRKAVHMARRTVSSEDQIIKAITDAL